MNTNQHQPMKVRVMPSKQILDACIKASEEIKELEVNMTAQRRGIKKIDYDGVEVYAGLTRKGTIRLMVGGKPLLAFPASDRVAIWRDIRDYFFESIGDENE